MTTSYQRTPLSERIAFSTVTDPKLKSNVLHIYFFQPLEPKTAAACALACGLVASSNAAFPSNEAMNRKLHLLYGADLSCSVARHGDFQLLSLHASAIADRYALNHEPLLQELTQILLDCLLNPNAKDNAFDETEFRIQQKELLDNIDAEINEKRIYAIRQAERTAFRGEPAAYSAMGTKEEVLALTPEKVYVAFQNMLQTAKIEILFVGPEKRPELLPLMQKAFSELPEKCPFEASFYVPSPAKEQPAEVVEALPVGQCKVVMQWKTNDTDRYAVRLMTMLLGGTPSSKLFLHVREQMSLCYYCAARYSEWKQTMTVDSGIDTVNLEKAKAAIQAELASLAHGDFTDEEVENLLLFTHNVLQSTGDSAESYITWYLTQICSGEELTPKEVEQRYRNVTREELIAAAKSMQLDTVYTMKPQE